MRHFAGPRSWGVWRCQHNDANVLVMPGRFISDEEAEKIVNVFLNTGFEGGRHQRRIDKIPAK